MPFLAALGLGGGPAGAAGAAGTTAAGAAASQGIGQLIKSSAQQGLQQGVQNMFTPQQGSAGGALSQDMSWMNGVMEQPPAQPITAAGNPDLLQQIRLRGQQQPNMSQLWQM